MQAAVLEPEAHGRDLIVSAQTGSGKTVAFGLAMADELLMDAAALAVTRPGASDSIPHAAELGGH